MAPWFMDTSLTEKETKKHSKIPCGVFISLATAEIDFTTPLVPAQTLVSRYLPQTNIKQI
jgi:hypothetical protein